MTFGPPLLIGLAQLLLFPAPLGIWVLGVVLGLLTALVALGMALVYRASRILNFAQADLGTAPVVLAVTLITGQVGLNYFLGFGLGLMAALAVGALVEVLIIRRFFRAPRLILTVATIGLSQLFTVVGLLLFRQKSASANGGAGSAAAFQNLAVDVPWHVKFTLGSRIYSANDVLAMIVAPLVVLGLGLFLRYTAVGVALRASADRADRASLLGVPVKRLQMLVWMLATAMSFVGLFLRAGVLGLPTVTTLSLAALAGALTALMVGRLTNLVSITAAAVALGTLEQGVTWNNGNNPNVVFPVFGVVILLALIGRRIGATRAEQDVSASWTAAEEVRPIPPELVGRREVATAKWLGLGVAFVLAVALPFFLDASGQFRASTVAVYALVGLSIVVLTGWAGQVSLGQLSFAAVGAALGSIATVEWNLDLSLSLLLAGLGGGLVAMFVGIPALRLRGIFLAVTTLGFALAASNYLLDAAQTQNWPISIPTRRFDAPLLFNHFNLTSQRTRYYVCLGCLVLGLLAVRGIRRSRTGRVLVALRENERGVQAYGVSLVRAKFTAFALSGFLAGVAGCLLAQIYGQYIDQSYTPGESFAAFTSVVVGGVGSMLGALLGALFLNGGKWLLSGSPKLALLPSAIGVLFVLIVVPGGLAHLVYRVRDRLLRSLARRRGIVVPSLLADSGEQDLLASSEASVSGASTVDGHRPGGAEAAMPPAGGSAPAPLLSVRQLDVCYGDVQVLFGIDFDVQEGEIIALLGTNGAGKSTLLKAVSGVLPASAGTVTFDGADITKVAPERVAAMRIAQVPGGQGVFPSLTVAENLRVAGWLQRHRKEEQQRQVERVLEVFPALRSTLTEPAANLSGGQQQMLALSMAFLVRPRLLAIDELSLGLAPVIVEQLLGIVAAMRDEGTTVILVEQSVNVALTVAETAYFMEKGQIRFHGPTAELLERPDVLRSVFLEGAMSLTSAPPRPAPSEPLRHRGGDVAASAAGRSPAEGAPVVNGHPATRGPALAVAGLSVHFGGIRAVDEVDLVVAPGEIVGIIGPNGAGKTTLFDLVSGYTRPDAGRVELGGRDVTRRSAPDRARLGLGRSFQDARLFPALTVAETLAVALERWVDVRDPFNAMFRLPAFQDSEVDTNRRVAELIELLGLGAFAGKFVGELSTGTRRVVDLACVIAHRPSVVLLDEPSSGIAQKEAEALGPLLVRIRDTLDASLVVIEHDMGLVTSVAERLVALDQGRVVAAGPPDEVLHHPEVVASYLGTGTVAVARSTHSSTTGATP